MSKLYAVVELAWTHHDGGWATRHPSYSEIVKLFRTEEKAKAYRNELEAKARTESNPFCYSEQQYAEGPFGPEEVTRLKEDAFAELVREVGLEPPNFGKSPKGKQALVRYWADWWEKTTMTTEQTAKLWQYCFVRFYAVCAVDDVID